MKKLWVAVALTLVAALMMVGSGWASTLQDVKARKYFKCGTDLNNPGFSALDSKGERFGFDVDFCKAVAAAVGIEVRYVPLTSKERLPALQSGEIDLLSRTTTWSMSRDTVQGLDFAATVLYDGQGIMVRKASGVKSAKQLNGATVCLTTGTTNELNVADFFRQNGITYKPVVFEKMDDVRNAYDANRCDAYTTDISGLAAQRSLLKNPNDHIVLPEVISKEPLAPVTRHGDNQWTDIVRWVINATITAEEYGITRQNVADIAKTTTNPDIQRFLGVTGTLWTDSGLDAGAPIRLLKAVGNYAEIFDRNLGPNTPLRMNRGLNALWNKGGILYAPPFR